MKPVLLAVALGSTALGADLFPFQLPWDDATPSVTDVSFLNDKPAGRDGFVTVKDGHLFVGEKRLRIFGVNICFAAAFPDKDMAPKVAARMAKFGINCVRFHHMDMMSAPGGIWAKDGKTLDPGQLDRLDWFIAKLKENGIYADLNLHVSRTYPDRPREQKKTNPDYDKGVDNYCAAMIAMQKDYARALLTHVNAYTGKAYAEEPAVAIVEINNENSLGFEWWAAQMDDLADVYRTEWEELWTKWIAKKYGSDEKAMTAWKDGARQPGGEILWGGGTALKKAPDVGQAVEAKWFFEQHEGAVAKGTVDGEHVTFKIDQPGKAQWHCQFSAAGLTLAKDERYEVRFRVKAPKETSISVTLMQSHEPWGQLGNTSVKAGPEWREVSALLTAHDADTNARVTIGGMGLSTGQYEFSGFSLRTAPIDGEITHDAAGHVPMVKKRELSKYTAAKQRDWQEFLWDTERTYWNGMRDFVKKDLGTHAAILGTQGFWSPGFVQEGMDVIDSHAYWHHPDFLGRGWNADVWMVKNESMAGAKDGGTLLGLAAQRVAGKPFICTEYNESAPNSHAAETFPLVLSYAALQDWDGIFAFSYSHRGPNEWGQEFFNNFFDIDRHAAKMATLPGAVLLWRRGDLVGRSSAEPAPEISYEAGLERALKNGPAMGISEFARKQEAMAKRFAYVPLPSGKQARPPGAMSSQIGNGETMHLEWLNERGQMWVDSPSSKLLVGKFGKDESFKFASGKAKEAAAVSISPGEGWGCFQVTVVGEKKRHLDDFERVLITATGNIENTGMSWKNPEKSTVGRDWGKAQVLVEGPAAKMEFPGAGKFKAWALDERGQRRAEISMTGSTLEIGPQYKTLWYEVERE